MIRKSIMFLLAALLCLSCTGCIEPVETEPNYEPLAEADSQLGIVNPVKELSRQELIEKSGIYLGSPDGAEDMVYSLISLAENSPIAQLRFTLDGQELCLRAQNISGENAIDISGMYYDWELTEHVFVSRNYAVVYLSADTGYIKWVYAPAGIQYSLSMAEGADRDKLIELAELVFEPLQAELGK